MAPPGSQRIDKWLFFARVVKSRSLAARLVQSGGVRINSVKIDQPSATVKPGDGVTVALERRILVYRVVSGGTRRGPAEEARTLFDDLTPPPAPREERVVAAEREPGTGRPTKRDRRLTDRLRQDDLD
ncbi:MAG: RNA-binding S4 domain-containing protein [Mesorhizobium sp.]|nr:RNA-binding S4 domain-containing protein [Mesorhizobium sp.]MCO5161607.1 RNA-binding S4 domain-containing protein [Mesorhizobium sp.]